MLWAQAIVPSHYRDPFPRFSAHFRWPYHISARSAGEREQERRQPERAGQLVVPFSSRRWIPRCDSPELNTCHTTGESMKRPDSARGNGEIPAPPPGSSIHSCTRPTPRIMSLAKGFIHFESFHGGLAGLEQPFLLGNHLSGDAPAIRLG